MLREGETRFSDGATPTTWRFTGQREDATIGLYYFNARYLDPQLGRFTQPDTIVPQPGNPQALNRYSYVLNNPLRYTDPTGYFTDDAIKAYLQNVYGNEWQMYWDAWSSDQTWMGLLRAAEGGDVMTRASWSNGSLALNHFLLAGSGQDLLSGMYQISQLTANPSVNTSVLLHELYLEPGEGMAVFRFSNVAPLVQVVRITGGISVVQYSATRGDVRTRNIADWLVITGIGRGISSWLGLMLGGGKALTSPEWGELPGRKVGDIHLWIGLSTDLGEYRRVSVYDTVLRDGVNLGRSGIFDGVQTWDVPKHVYRRY